MNGANKQGWGRVRTGYVEESGVTVIFTPIWPLLVRNPIQPQARRLSLMRSSWIIKSYDPSLRKGVGEGRGLVAPAYTRMISHDLHRTWS